MDKISIVVIDDGGSRNEYKIKSSDVPKLRQHCDLVIDVYDVDLMRLDTVEEVNAYIESAAR